MWTPPPSRRVVSSSAPATLLLRLLLLAGAAGAAPPLVGVSLQDEAYFAPQVIACRDGSGSFPRNRLNDGYCDCADGTDEPGTSACPEGKFYCKNIGGTPRLLFSSFVNDKICDCCDGSDEYESGIDCQNTCKAVNDISGSDDGGRNISATHFDATTEVTSKHTTAMEDRIQNIINSKDLILKLRGLKMAVAIELGLAVCIFAFCVSRRRTRARRRQHILKR